MSMYSKPINLIISIDFFSGRLWIAQNEKGDSLYYIRHWVELEYFVMWKDDDAICKLVK